MRLCVATNWSDDLVERLTPYPIKELYGSLPKTPIGGGRPSMILPSISKEHAAMHITRVLAQGWGFNYLMNAVCLCTPQGWEKTRHAVLEHLKWVAGLGVQTVTVANPLMLDLVKYHFANLKVKISILLDVDSVNNALYLESRGADDIALSIMANRDFHFLQHVKKKVTCDLTLLLNQACLYMCPYRFYHGTVNAHASSSMSGDEGFAINYCLLKCSIEKLSKPKNLIKSRWIRPDDLSVYEAMGFDTFKIAGREMSTDWLVNATRAYSNRSYEGNLSDILNGIAVMMGSGGPESRKMPYIDNEKLSGFLDFFKTKNCSLDCMGCTYCERIADKAIDSFKNENEKFLETLKTIAEHMI